MSAKTRKESLRYFFSKVIAPMGFKFSPDTELVDMCLEGEVSIEAKHGSPFCPCKLLKHDRASDMKIVCPCIPFNRKHFDAMKRCWCGLFVHLDVTDPDSLPQLTAEELGIE